MKPERHGEEAVGEEVSGEGVVMLQQIGGEAGMKEDHVPGGEEADAGERVQRGPMACEPGGFRVQGDIRWQIVRHHFLGCSELVGSAVPEYPMTGAG
jgi:hypothetical protein